MISAPRSPARRGYMMRTSENVLMKNATAIALVTVTILMGSAAFTFHRQGEDSLSAKNWVMHTREATSHIQELTHTIEDAEVVLRGYIITGKEVYLDSYKAALIDSTDPHSQVNDLGSRYSILEEIGILRELTADNPVQQ